MNPDTPMRVTRVEAARIAGVSARTISRWASAGRLNVVYIRSSNGALATYDPEEVAATHTLVGACGHKGHCFRAACRTPAGASA